MLDRTGLVRAGVADRAETEAATQRLRTVGLSCQPTASLLLCPSLRYGAEAHIPGRAVYHKGEQQMVNWVAATGVESWV